MSNLKLGAILLPVLVGAAGCLFDGDSGDSSDILRQNQAFVAISHPLSPAPRGAQVRSSMAGVETQAVPRADGKESFYIAIHKRELNRRYFLSAYMKQAYPGTVEAGAGATLGTRVVTFRVQNGKLFVFDAQDGRASSDTFDPTLIIEAYPIVDGYAPFSGLAGHDDYILFDPSAGLNRFGAVSDRFAKSSEPLHFQIDVSYMQNFRRINDGTTFEQVFTGAVNDTLKDGPSNGANAYTASGTLGLALRRYSEGEGFHPFDAAKAGKEFYFLADPLMEKNTGGAVSWATKWNVHPGMKPITWLISDKFAEVAKENPKYDIVGAIKAGVENWNAVFGFKVFEAQMASPQDSFADDDKNYFIYDGDPTYDYAFADARVNPNTGEIRGASVYFNAATLQDAIDEFDPPAGAAPRASKRAARPKAPQITWGGFRGARLCTFFAPTSAAAHGDLDLAGAPRGVKQAGPREVEKFITHVAVHEVGHNLGLRHNFKGSLAAEQSSVMEYIIDPDAVAANRDRPGPYDYDAIKRLYGMAPRDPAQPFCTDEDLEIDPACATYDRSDDPLVKYWGPEYNARLTALLRGQDPTGMIKQRLERYLGGTAAFLRAGAEADQARAWAQLDKQLALGVDHTADNLNYPGYTERSSEFQNLLLNRLFFDAAELRGDVTKDPALTGAALTAVVTELQGVIANSDKYRGWNTRRTSVDVLKKLQAQSAYNALLAARQSVVSATYPTGSPDAALRDDLVARIDAATHPYFK